MDKKHHLEENLKNKAETLGKEVLCDLGLHIPKDGKVTARQAVILNRVEQEVPSTSNIAKAGNIELQEIMQMATRSMEDINAQ